MLLTCVFIFNSLYSVSMEICVLNYFLGKFLDHVLVEMGYGLKPKGQNSKKQSTDQSEYIDEYKECSGFSYWRASSLLSQKGRTVGPQRIVMMTAIL